MDRTKTGGLKLTQPNLIERILKATHRKVRKRKTPTNKVLQKDLGGHDRRETWDYKSVMT